MTERTRLDVALEGLSSDIQTLAAKVLEVHQYLERSREEDRQERAADRGDLLAILRNSNRRIRAIERLESRRNQAGRGEP